MSWQKKAAKEDIGRTCYANFRWLAHGPASGGSKENLKPSRLGTCCVMCTYVVLIGRVEAFYTGMAT